jgi:hypothetical protein
MGGKRLLVGIVITVIFLSAFLNDARGADEQRWKHYATSVGGHEYFYDSKTVVNISNTNVKVWVRMFAPDSDETTYKEQKLYEMDCSKRVYRLLFLLWEFKSGQVIRHEEPTAWSDIQPETVDETLLDIVCKKVKPSKKNK